MKKQLIMAMMALAAATAAWAENAAFARATGARMRLDTRTGTRLAAMGASETIAYSPQWGGDGGGAVVTQCRVTADGAVLKTASEEGEVEWSPDSTGAHTLTHTAGDEMLTAQFTVLGDDVAQHAGALAASETWGSNQVHLVTTAVTIPSGKTLTIERGAVVKFMTGTALTVNGTCTAYGVIFTHVSDDTAGGDTLMDGDATKPVMDGYKLSGNIYEDDATEERYTAPQTLTSSISGTLRLKGHKVYLANSSITVNSGATLTLLPGAIIKFASGCSMTVNGTLDAQGTRAAPIVFTSQKDDDWGGDTNVDGEKTYAQAGDWGRIYAGGMVNMNHCRIRHCNNNSDQGAIQGNGGTVTFDNGVIESSVYECVRMNSGRFVAHNSVFRDSSMGFGYYGGSGTYAYNCVIADCTVGCRASNKHFYNTVFYRCKDAFLESTASSCDHCVFYNPPGYGPQSATQVGKDGNIWGDPKFVDPDKGDFRIAADSPCIDAGDGTVAPELDYYGRPRMDAKGKKATGVPNADGICPDIGIYEFSGKAIVPAADLAVLSVTAPSAAVPGEELAITYVVTNRGAADATGMVRDQIALKGAEAALGGQTIAAGEVEQLYSLAVGAAATFTARVKCPAAKSGAWLVGVTANAERDVFEQVTANNTGWAGAATAIALESLAAGECRVAVAAGTAKGFAVEKGARVIRVLADATPDGNLALSKLSVYGANGAVPQSAEGGVAAVRLGDGSWLLVLPEASVDERGYVVIENGGAAEVELKVTAEAEQLAVYGVAPNRVAAVEGVSVTITGTGLAEDQEVTLGGRTATRVTKVNEAQIVATFDLKGMATGAATVEVRSDGVSPSQGSVDVYKTTQGPKLEAKLELPSSVRDGRIYTAYVVYANVGDEPMTMPVFKVERTDSSTKFGHAAGTAMNETRVFVGGISPNHPAGVLQPGDGGRIPVFFMPSGRYGLKLTHTKETDNAEQFAAFGGVKPYLAAMSAAATRLNLRGRTEYSAHEFVDQALWEKNGVACAAVSGHLRDALTHEPIANVGIALVATNDESSVAVNATTDETGYFQIRNVADGDYRWMLDSGNALVSSNVVTVSGQTDLNGVEVLARAGGRIAGYVYGADGAVLAGVAVALYDADGELRTVTSSDEMARFEFAGLPDGEYSVRCASVGGFVCAASASMAVDASVRSHQIELMLEEGGRVTGTVRTGGLAVTNGIVRAAAEGGQLIETLCSAEGTYLFDGLPAGAYSIQYYTAELLSEDLDISVEVGKTATLDLEAGERPIFYPTSERGFDALTTSFVFCDADRKTNVVAWAWDFDDDGIVDSTVAEPSWTYSSLGTNTVRLTITERGGKVTTSRAEACCIVEKALPTVYKDGAIVFGENSGTLSVDSIGEDTMTLTGDPRDGEIRAGMAIMGRHENKWFLYRIRSASKNGGVWTLEVSQGEITDIYEQLTYAGTSDLSIEDEPRRLFSASPSRQGRALKAAGADDGPGVTTKVFAEGGIKWTLSATPGLKLDYVRSVVNGVKYERTAVVGTLCFRAEGEAAGEVGVRTNAKIPIPLKIVVPAGGPLLDVEAGASLYATMQASCKGSLRASCATTYTLRLGKERYGNGQAKWLSQIPPKNAYDVAADISGNFLFQVGFKPEIKLRAIGFMTLGADLDVYAKTEGKFTTEREAEVAGTLGVNLDVEANLVDLEFSWIDVKFGVGATLEGPKAEFAKITAPVPKFSWVPGKPKVMEAVQFVNNTEDGSWNVFGIKSPVKPTGYYWDFNGLKRYDEEPTIYFPMEGSYPVSLRVTGDVISGPFALKKTVVVGKEEQEDDGEDITDNTGGGTPAKSCDPNEMAGPLGTGDSETERFVKPGEWMDYTIYFENKTNAEVAAQEVFVDAQLSEWLDWSTFEMGEVAFNNQNETVLAGLKNGLKTVAQNGADYKVQLSVAFDETTGKAHWYLRSYDPSQAEYGYWPAAVDAGFLPPNDETHRGEGHITYRVKVREDAPKGVRIDAAATIVFDKNDPIPTDPAWWNTVGSTGGEAAFAAAELTVDEGGTLKVVVSGGHETLASSVQVLATYNTAAAADLDLKGAMVDGAKPKAFKFPVTLEWAAGEIGEKTVEIPVVIDKTVEADEFLTLELANPMNLARGETPACTVTIHDPQYDALKAKVAAGTATKAEADALAKADKVFAGKAYVRGLANDATRGKVTGSALAAEGKNVLLKATANKGFVFAGWYTDPACTAGHELAGYGDYRNPSLSWPNTNGAVTVYARFVAPEEDSLSLGEDFLPAELVVGHNRYVPVPVESVSYPTVTFSGLPSGVRYDAAIRGLTGAPKAATAKPVTVTVTVKNLGGYQIVRKYELSVVTFNDMDPSEPPAKLLSDAGPYQSVAVGVSDDFAGKVTGAGVYQAGKKVTLKATANKGYAFSAWYEGGIDGGLGVTALPAGEQVSQLASYSFTMPTNDVAFTAKFVTVEEDAASVGATVDGFAFGAACDGEAVTRMATNVMCGVYLEWPVAVCALSQPTVAVSGLPAGLKFTAKDIMKKGSKTEVEIPANTIYGAPTAASKVDAKTGAVVPSTVKVTVTTAGKSKAVYEISLTVDPLPAWAQGEFSGLASTPEGRLGGASMSVTAAGKVSGKVIVNGTNVSFSAANYDIASRTVGETSLVAKVEGKLGRETVAGEITVVASGATGTFAGAEMSLCRNVWKDKGAEPVPAEAQGLYTVKLGAGDRGTGYLSLTVDKKGAVKVAGKATDGTALSASATLMPGSGETRYFADVFAAPSAYKGGYVAGRLAWDAEGRVSSDGLAWTSFNPESTADYYAGGFVRGLSASGAWYSKTAKLLDYYATLDFEAENRGVGQSCWANLTVSVDQTGKKFVVDQKKTAPVQDKATKAWSYEGANDAALEFSFTQATGIWKGSFLWWLDEPKHASQKIPFEGIMVQGEDLEGFGTYDVPASYVPYDKKGQPQKEKAYKCKESVPVSFTEAE